VRLEPVVASVGVGAATAAAGASLVSWTPRTSRGASFWMLAPPTARVVVVVEVEVEVDVEVLLDVVVLDDEVVVVGGVTSVQHTTLLFWVLSFSADGVPERRTRAHSSSPTSRVAGTVNT
jgi:hypothetical protein